MPYAIGLKCINCGSEFSHKKPFHRCPKCGGLLDVEYDYDSLADWFDLDKIRRREPTIWKWKEFMPIEDETKIVSLGEGGTPLLKCDRIAREVGVKELYVKDDAMTQPTGSLKDRSIPVAATKAREFGFGVLSCDSTGNKAASTAAYAARAGLGCVVFCPSDAPLEKLIQALVYGAKLVRINANYDVIDEYYNELIASGKFNWYDCGPNNPFRYEGKKTYAYENCESLDWQVPDWILHPSAGSHSVIKTLKGYKELQKLDLIGDKLPRMVAVQAEAAAPIVRAFEEGWERVKPVEAKETIASGIRVGNPPFGDWTLRVIRESKGSAVAVSEDEIVYGMKLLGREGIFSEPTGAVAIPAVKKLVNEGTIDKNESVICNVTGYGFKDIEIAKKLVKMPKGIEAESETIEKFATKLFSHA